MHSVLLLLADSNFRFFLNSHLLICVNSDFLLMDNKHQYTEKKKIKPPQIKVLCNKTELFCIKPLTKCSISHLI